MVILTAYRRGNSLINCRSVVKCLYEHYVSKAVVPKRCVATPWCVGRDHEVCREIKKIFKLRLMIIINN
jgi:hypothetical protein